MRFMLIAALAAVGSLAIAPGVALAKAPCKDASGKFVTCPATTPAAAKPAAKAAPAKPAATTKTAAAKPAAATGTAAPASSKSAMAPGTAKTGAQCKTGKPCGNSCIAQDKVCHK
jgi:hypothetical protein